MRIRVTSRLAVEFAEIPPAGDVLNAVRTQTRYGKYHKETKKLMGEPNDRANTAGARVC